MEKTLTPQQRWYQKNREKQKEKQRQRSRELTQQRKEYLQQNPEEIEAIREQWREKYHRSVTSTIKKRIEELLDHPLTASPTKALLRTILKEETYKTMKKRDMSAIEKLANINNGAEENRIRREDGKEKASEEREASFCNHSRTDYDSTVGIVTD